MKTKKEQTPEEKAHSQDVDNLPQETELNFKIRKEFGINYREYYYMCFEGSYVPEFIEFALAAKDKQIRQKVENLKKEIRTYIKNSDNGNVDEYLKGVLRLIEEQFGEYK